MPYIHDVPLYDMMGQKFYPSRVLLQNVWYARPSNILGKQGAEKVLYLRVYGERLISYRQAIVEFFQMERALVKGIIYVPNQTIGYLLVLISE